GWLLTALAFAFALALALAGLRRRRAGAVAGAGDGVERRGAAERETRRAGGVEVAQAAGAVDAGGAERRAVDERRLAEIAGAFPFSFSFTFTFAFPDGERGAEATLHGAPVDALVRLRAAGAVHLALTARRRRDDARKRGVGAGKGAR